MYNKIITYLLLITLIFSSCEKYELTEGYPTIENTLWVLNSGNVYVENLTNGEMVYYNHFDNSQDISNLDIFGGSQIDIDNIELGVTTWYFNDGIFVLNNGSTYEYNSSGSGVAKNYTLLGIPPYGSVRHLGVIYLDENILQVKIYESNESYDGDNYHYYTVLTFVRDGYSCSDCDFESRLDYTFGGTITINIEDIPGHLQLSGTTWVITRYDNGTTPYYPNDTINFISGVAYSINGLNTNTYSLSNNVGNNLYNLTLYECITIGGNYSGQVSLSSIIDGELNNILMNGIFGTNNSINLWMEKIN